MDRDPAYMAAVAQDATRCERDAEAMVTAAMAEDWDSVLDVFNDSPTKAALIVVLARLAATIHLVHSENQGGDREAAAAAWAAWCLWGRTHER